jgi:hypothetical protein
VILRATALFLVEGIVLGAVGWVGYRLLIHSARRMRLGWAERHAPPWGYLRFAIAATLITAGGSVVGGHEFVWLYPVALALVVTGGIAFVVARFFPRKPPADPT